MGSQKVFPSPAVGGMRGHMGEDIALSLDNLGSHPSVMPDLGVTIIVTITPLSIQKTFLSYPLTLTITPPSGVGREGPGVPEPLQMFQRRGLGFRA